MNSSNIVASYPIDGVDTFPSGIQINVKKKNKEKRNLNQDLGKTAQKIYPLRLLADDSSDSYETDTESTGLYLENDNQGKDEEMCSVNNVFPEDCLEAKSEGKLEMLLSEMNGKPQNDDIYDLPTYKDNLYESDEVFSVGKLSNMPLSNCHKKLDSGLCRDNEDSGEAVHPLKKLCSINLKTKEMVDVQHTKQKKRTNFCLESITDLPDLNFSNMDDISYDIDHMNHIYVKKGLAEIESDLKPTLGEQKSDLSITAKVLSEGETDDDGSNSSCLLTVTDKSHCTNAAVKCHGKRSLNPKKIRKKGICQQQRPEMEQKLVEKLSDDCFSSLANSACSSMKCEISNSNSKSICDDLETNGKEDLESSDATTACKKVKEQDILVIDSDSDSDCDAIQVIRVKLGRSSRSCAVLEKSDVDITNSRETTSSNGVASSSSCFDLTSSSDSKIDADESLLSVKSCEIPDTPFSQLENCIKCSSPTSLNKMIVCPQMHFVCYQCVEEETKRLLAESTVGGLVCLSLSCNEYYSKNQLSMSMNPVLVDILHMRMENTMVNMVYDLENKESTNPVKNVPNYSDLDEPLELQVPYKSELPEHWDFMNNQNISLVTLVPGSEEYANQATQFHTSLQFPEHDIIEIQRVQNLHMWKFFKVKLEQMRDEVSGQEVEERFLYHGTSFKCVNNIYRRNFDWRLSGSVNGTVYGQGTYFAVTASLSHKYSSRGVWKNTLLKGIQPSVSSAASMYQATPLLHIPATHSYLQSQSLARRRRSRKAKKLLSIIDRSCGICSLGLPPGFPSHLNGDLGTEMEDESSSLHELEDFYMIVARVIVGEYTVGHHQFKLPPAFSSAEGENDRRYDSCVDSVSNPNIFVIFDNSQMYPEYIIKYNVANIFKD